MGIRTTSLKMVRLRCRFRLAAHGPLGNNPFEACATLTFWITVENRDYHYLSQSEIASDKRISQHLSGPAHLQKPFPNKAIYREAASNRDKAAQCCRWGFRCGVAAVLSQLGSRNWA